MKVIYRDERYSKEKKDVQRSINMAVERLKKRLSVYVEGQHLEPNKIFGDDILIHDIVNKYWYVFKCKVNQMQIRILYTFEDGNLIILSHWYKNRTNNDWVYYFREITKPMRESRVS